jgi:hypothetical protein
MVNLDYIYSLSDLHRSNHVIDGMSCITQNHSRSSSCVEIQLSLVSSYHLPHILAFQTFSSIPPLLDASNLHTTKHQPSLLRSAA